MLNDLIEKLNKLKEQSGALSEITNNVTNAINVLSNEEYSDIKESAIDYLRKTVNEILGSDPEDIPMSSRDSNDDLDLDMDINMDY